MKKGKIEIFWYYTPNAENQFKDENEISYRIKSDDFDFVIGNIVTDKDDFDNRKALNLIVGELIKPIKERVQPIIFDWFSNRKESEDNNGNL